MISPSLQEVQPRGANPIGALFRAMRPRRIRTFREFVEQELVLPNGPRKGERFDCSFMPWTSLVLDEFSHSRYRRFWASGPVQSGKTLIFFVIPLLYHLFEIGENVIVGVPKLDLAQGIYNERALPAILSSKYRNLLPSKGAGSRRGKFESIQFENGAILRFMGAGGGDEQRSSHTARVIILTETDKMDEPGKASREADPVTQFEARARAFGQRARIYAECTMSTKRGRVNKEVTIRGTDTKIALPCPHCGVYVVPEREHFTGWQEAVTLPDAMSKGVFLCPSCEKPWTELQRLSSLRTPLLVSRGQEVDKNGRLTGDLPDTDTWGFHWNAMHNALISMRDIAEAEYLAESSDSVEEKKALMQFTWAEPFEEDITDLSALNREVILAKIGKHPRGIVPEGTEERLTVFIDVGKYICWWAAWAWRDDRQGYLIDYGSITVPQGHKTSPLAILAALRAFRDDVLKPGWATADGQQAVHRLCFVDSGYERKIVYEFVRESGQQTYRATKGLGSGRNQDSWREPRKAKHRVIGNNWFVTRQPGSIRLVNMNSDFWKQQVHEGFVAPAGTPGALNLFDSSEIDFRQFARQIIAERRLEEFVPGKGLRVFWDCVDKNNHWLDCTYGCLVAADMLGATTLPKKESKARAQYQEKQPEGGKKRKNWLIGR